MVVADGGRCPIEGHVKRDFGRCTGKEATGIRIDWREGRSVGIGYQRSDGRIRGSGIGDGRHSGEQRTPCRYNAVSVYLDRDRG